MDNYLCLTAEAKLSRYYLLLQKMQKHIKENIYVKQLFEELTPNNNGLCREH
jgi:hypothetical protein